MAWIEVSLAATQEAIDWVRTGLAKTAYAGPVYVAPLSDRASADETMAWAYTVRLYVPDTAEGDRLLAAIADQFHALQRTQLISEFAVATCATIPPAPDSLAPMQQAIGERFVLVSSGAEYPPEPTQRVIHLDQSLAFGSGFHPATILSLRLMERHVQPGMAALDLGCGSGILSVGLAKVGATVLALDNDPIAIAATQAMAHRNGVAEQITVQAGSLGSGSALGHWLGGELPTVPTVSPNGTLDVIVANILARVHIALAAEYRAALRWVAGASAQLITAGLTTDYETDVVATLQTVGFEVVERDRLDEWVAIAYRLRPSAE